MDKAEDEIDLEWIQTVFERHNPHVRRSTDPVADFVFERSLWGLTATAYTRGYIPLTDELLFEFEEPKFKSRALSDTGVRIRSLRTVANDSYHNSHPERLASDRPVALTPRGLHQLQKSFPSFFDEEKKLVLLDGHAENTPDHVRELIQEIKDRGDKPANYVFLPVLQRSGGFPEGEPLFEYLSALHFIEQGYITSISTGADLHVYRIPQLHDEVGGRFAFELLFDPSEPVFTGDPQTDRAYAIEVEPTQQRTMSSGSSGIGQIQSKEYHHGFSGAYTAGPANREYAASRRSSPSSIGALVFDGRGRKHQFAPEQELNVYDEEIESFLNFAGSLLLEPQYEHLQSEIPTFAEYVERITQTTIDPAISDD